MAGHDVGVVALWSASTLPPIVIASALTAVAALVAAVLGFVGNRRGSRDSRELGYIHEAQDVLRDENARLRQDLGEARAEVSATRAEVAGLREQVTAMRSELAAALSQHSDCEHARAVLERIIADLRRQLGFPGE